VARTVMDHYMQSPSQPAPANPMIMTAVPRPQVAH
jgi:hypothetical protein